MEKPLGPVTENSLQVLHGTSHIGLAVALHNRKIDEVVHFQNLP